MRTPFVTFAISTASALALAAGCAEAQVKAPAAQPYTCSSATCKVAITVDCTVSPCAIGVDRDPLTVKGVKNASIVWTLPSGYLFCPALGDGVFLKKEADVDDQFYDNYSTDDENGRPMVNLMKAGKKSYHWKDQNTVKKTYSYKMIFHDATCRTSFEKDPTIINDM